MTNPSPTEPIPAPEHSAAAGGDAPRWTSPPDAPWHSPPNPATAAADTPPTTPTGPDAPSPGSSSTGGTTDAPAGQGPAADAPHTQSGGGGPADAPASTGSGADTPATNRAPADTPASSGADTPAGTNPQADTRAPAGSSAPADAQPHPGTPADPNKPSLASRGLNAAGLPPDQLKNLSNHPVKGIPGLLKSQWDTGSRLTSGLAGAANLSPKLVSAARFVPVLGSVAAIGMAASDFANGDYIGGTLNAIGAIPGPVGWVSLGAGFLWDAFGDESIEMWAKPDGTVTFMLPGAGQDISGVVETDVALTAAQRDLYSFQDGPTGTVWNSNPPNPLALNTPAVAEAARTWLTGLSELFSKVETAMQSSGEPYFEQYRARLAPHLATMADLTPACQALITQLGEVDGATAAAYSAVLEANRNLRVQLSEGGELTDAGPATALTSTLAAAATAITAANGRIAGAFPAASPPMTPSAAARADKSLTTPAPAPATLAPAAGPGAGTPAKPAETAKKPTDDLSKLLNSLGQQKPLGGGSPLGGGGNPLGGMGGGSPLGGGNPMGNGQGRKLDGGEGRKLDDKADRKLDDKERKPLEEKSDRKLSTAGGPANSVAAAPAPAGAPAGTPAVKPEAAAAKPGSPTKPNTEVDVKGEKTDFKDPKLAKMAQLLASATPQQPMSLSDAAAASGLTPPVPHADPGRQVQPVDAKPGDILVADGKQFMLLGEGRFYDLQDFKTVGASELPQDAGSRGGYFSLNDPRDPSGGGAPVSPPAGGVPHDVPGGQPPAATVDASPTVAGAPDPVDNPEAQSAPPAGSGVLPAVPPTGGVPSGGTPGVPAAGNGNGPANAGATATGNGIPEPSSRTTALDPSAVK
jgi:hypothetical protein